MARIKYFNTETQTWEYADTSIGQKGDPYVLTEADKAELVQKVVAALPTYNGEVEAV